MKILQILVLTFCFVAFANSQTVLITGTIYDEQGAVITQTNVKAVNEKGEKIENLTDEAGIFTINVPVGKYSLEFYKYGFTKTIVTDFYAEEKEIYNFDLNLEVGEIVSELVCEVRKNDREKPDCVYVSREPKKVIKFSEMKSNKFIKRKIINNE